MRPTPICPQSRGCCQPATFRLTAWENFESFVVAEEGWQSPARSDWSCLAAPCFASAVVASEHRGTGVGRRLVEQILERADRYGVGEIYLLTTTAEEYFPRFGFARTTRAAVPDAVKASAEFRGACPDTAVVMKRRIGAGRANKVRRIALISDIHANLPALDAVLGDIDRRAGIEAIYHLGDLTGYAPWPNEVVTLLRERGIAGISGNYDSTIATDYKHCGCRADTPAR